MEALGRLAGGVAHDFNNVLQAVKGGVALAAKRVRRDPDGALRYLDLAADATERGAAVTGRLLSFARPGSFPSRRSSPQPPLRVESRRAHNPPPHGRVPGSRATKRTGCFRPEADRRLSGLTGQKQTFAAVRRAAAFDPWRKLKHQPRAIALRLFKRMA